MWTLVNPLHTVWLPPDHTLRFVQAEVALYAQVTNGLGQFRFRIQFTDVGTGTILGESDLTPHDFRAENRSDVLELVFVLRRLPIPRAGLYEFKLLANHVELEDGAITLRVFAEDQP